jgi:hypothetical protein
MRRPRIAGQFVWILTAIVCAMLRGAPYSATVVSDPVGHAVKDFTSTLAGTVNLSATDLRFSAPNLDLLTGMVTNVALMSGGPTLVLSGTGVLEFQIERNQSFTTSLYGLAAGPTGIGMASLNLSFTPRVGEVPLPAGVWLLASGAALLAARSRRRASAGASPA